MLRVGGHCRGAGFQPAMPRQVENLPHGLDVPENKPALNRATLRSRQFERILLIKPSAVGDVIHTVPVLARLRTRYPQARIDWLLTPAIAEWIGHHPALS